MCYTFSPSHFALIPEGFQEIFINGEVLGEKMSYFSFANGLLTCAPDLDDVQLM